MITLETQLMLLAGFPVLKEILQVGLGISFGSGPVVLPIIASSWASVSAIFIQDFPALLNESTPTKRITTLHAETMARSVSTERLVGAAPLVKRDVSASVT